MPILAKNVTPGCHQVRIQVDGYAEKNERISLDHRKNKISKVD
jgi:hypothetical protein